MFSCGSTSNVQRKNPPKTSIEIPDSLEIDTIEKININDLTIEIFIAYNRGRTATYEYWYEKGKQIHIIDYPVFDINYKWLVDLDGDNNLEIIRAQGYEDGVNYGLYKKTRNSEELLLTFNPALLDERYPNKLFWGYPRDMKKIIMNSEKQILSSFQISSERDDNYSMAENQKQMPYLFFHGTTTQPEFELKITPSETEYVTLKGLMVRSFQANEIKYHLPVDSYILDSVTSKINNSFYTILSIEKLPKKNRISDSHFDLPIVILRDSVLMDKNIDLVYSYDNNCPTDGYSGVYVEGVQFTIQQTFCADFLFVSSNTTFRINPSNNEIILYEYVEEYMDRSNPDRSIPFKKWTSKDFGKVLFRETTESFLKEMRQTEPK